LPKSFLILSRSFSFEELLGVGSWQEAGQAGKIKLEGKDYQVKDGDVIEFKFTS
jgi:hypothetical protein